MLVFVVDIRNTALVCAARDPIVKEKLVKTNLEKYGVEHPSQLKEYNDKML